MTYEGPDDEVKTVSAHDAIDNNNFNIVSNS